MDPVLESRLGLILSRYKVTINPEIIKTKLESIRLTYVTKHPQECDEFDCLETMVKIIRSSCIFEFILGCDIYEGGCGEKKKGYTSYNTSKCENRGIKPEYVNTVLNLTRDLVDYLLVFQDVNLVYEIQDGDFKRLLNLKNDIF